MDERPFSETIPDVECEIYYLCVQQAIDLAETGEVLAGRRCLEGQQSRAEAMTHGHAWAEELIELYRGSLGRYVGSYPGQSLE